MVTGAVRLPQVASVARIGTPASSSGGATGPAAEGAALAVGAEARGAAPPHATSALGKATKPMNGTQATKKLWFKGVRTGSYDFDLL